MRASAPVGNSPGSTIRNFQNFFEPDGSIVSRLRRKMMQGDICHKLDMDRIYMSAIEGGKKNITIAKLEELTNSLDASVDELLK